MRQDTVDEDEVLIGGVFGAGMPVFGGGIEFLVLDADGRITADHMFPG